MGSLCGTCLPGVEEDEGLRDAVVGRVAQVQPVVAGGVLRREGEEAAGAPEQPQAVDRRREEPQREKAAGTLHGVQEASQHLRGRAGALAELLHLGVAEDEVLRERIMLDPEDVRMLIRAAIDSEHSTTYDVLQRQQNGIL